MGRLYTVVFEAVAMTVAQDYFEITPADDKPIALHGISLGQHTDFGDAQDENLRWSVVRGHATSGSGGSAPTPQPLSPIDAAAGFTAEVNNTTIASTGTTATLHVGAFNVRAGLDFFWPPECRPKASQANTSLVVRMASTAPADSITFSGTLYVEELI